jgi:hypothetical protein
MIRTMMMFLILFGFAQAARAQYREPSAWEPTQMEGVSYRWSVDNTAQRVCTVQIQNTVSDFDSASRVMVRYMDPAGNSSTIYLMMRTTVRGKLSRERVLFNCGWIDHVEVDSVTRP